MRFIGIPLVAKILYSKAKKSFPKAKGKLFFTFDDGPDPNVTPLVLDLLKQYDAKATFFCIGKNVEQFTALFERIKLEGHSIGNHTYNHINGFKTRTSEYLTEVDQAHKIIPSTLFRPPYGKMRLNQYYKLAKNYKIILWDVMSYDFDPLISPQDCETLVKENAKNGSIVVFHDMLKAKTSLVPTLQNLLKYYSNMGYSFESIPLYDSE